MTQPSPADEYSTWLENNLQDLQREFCQDNSNHFDEFCREMAAETASKQ